MQFIPTGNLKSQLKQSARQAADLFVRADTGDTNQLYFASTSNTNYNPFLIPSNQYGSDKTAESNAWLFPYASSRDDYTATTYTYSEVVGSSTIRFAREDKGWTATITITGTETATIKTLVFVRNLYSSSSSSHPAIIFFLKLDNPVELNAENNYTANFTFSIEFD